MQSLLVVLLASTAALALRPEQRLGQTVAPEDAPAFGAEFLEGPDYHSTSWFSRVGGTLYAVLLGLFIVIPLSTSLLWVNERRAAQLETLLGAGQGEAETVEATAPAVDLSDYDGCLVHLNSELVRGIEPVQDKRFPEVMLASGCIKLRTTVEVFQWEEDKHSEAKKDNLGGGITTSTGYRYRRAWGAIKSDSRQFHRSQEHRNMIKVENLRPGTEEVVNGLVKYGEAYRLEREMIVQLQSFQDMEELLGSTLRFGTYQFHRHEDGYYYYPIYRATQGIGDFRVKAEYMPECPASVLALQKTAKGGERTFAPYRTVRRRLCGDHDELRQRRLSAAAMTNDEICQQEKCWDFGLFCCLCAWCNLMTELFSGGLPPQIHRIYVGILSKSQCFDQEQRSAGFKKWYLRLLAWLGLWMGLNMVLRPLPVFLAVIPFVGPWISAGSSFVISLVTFLFTLLLASILASAAYLIYRPFLGVLYLAMTAGVVCLLYVLGLIGYFPAPAPAL